MIGNSRSLLRRDDKKSFVQGQHQERNGQVDKACFVFIFTHLSYKLISLFYVYATHIPHRETCIDRMHFNEKGVIKSVRITIDGVEAHAL